MDLPNEILQIIFEFLDLDDQVSAALTSRRFHNVLINIWQRKYKNFNLHASEIAYRDLCTLLASIHDNVETMKIDELSFEEWTIIRRHLYPNVKTLILPKYNEFCDDNVLELTKAFPNLRILTLCNDNISGIYIKDLKLLENLSLDCFDISFEQIQEILEELHLKTIELEDFYWKDKWTSERAFQNFCSLERICCVDCKPIFPFDITVFFNLQKFEISFDQNDLDDKIFRDIATYKHNDLIELHVRACLPLRVILNRTFENLKKVSIEDGDFSDFTNIMPYTPHLSEICLRHCGGLREAHISMFLNSIQIEFIDIIYCECEFTNFNLNINDIVMNRTKLLHFNFYGNKHKNICYGEEVQLNVAGSSFLLKTTQNSNCSNKIKRSELENDGSSRMHASFTFLHMLNMQDQNIAVPME